MIGSTNGDGLVDMGPFLQNPEQEYTREQNITHKKCQMPLKLYLEVGKDNVESI